MGLTSRSLMYTVAFAAVLCVALMVWIWPRLSGRGPLPVLGRLGAILLTQLSIMAAVLLVVNSSVGFFGTWNQLLGRVDKAPVNVTQMNSGTGPRASVSETKDGLIQPTGGERVEKFAGYPKGPEDKVGAVRSVRVIGKRTLAVNSAYIYLPPEYFQKQYERARFPVMVVVSGYPGGRVSLARNLQVPLNAARLLEEKKMAPTVIVMMSPTIAQPRDTECVDVPDGPQAETFLTKDLPDALRSTYRVGQDATAWGIMGYSTGGTCALQLAMRAPDVYPVAASLSGDLSVKNDIATGDLFGGGEKGKQRKREHDLMWRLRNLPTPPVSLLLATSRKGEKNFHDTEEFLRLAAEKKLRTASIVLPEGSHQFSTWRREIGPVMEWMSKELTFPQDTEGGKKPGEEKKQDEKKQDEKGKDEKGKEGDGKAGGEDAEVKVDGKDGEVKGAGNADDGKADGDADPKRQGDGEDERG
ncbi:esterase [Streptomyces mobaraensis NBRC 13819 = DSM 40847]|uniref:Esterase n=1 Tax=Streptomyces mobaraensis (strain ATCC 29032 / DSM 40847 / JCM 4168 / NBRC 13819 / NCIMB 11159 / IPCR 16-22) TaxID=1223523 RepID=M3AZG6_STRM1|nr:alpha/beta hydrolase-fold protein [Streptomyces mobaraensis]EME99062.1 esterase [Streptomyces mobaraensis NBRC 13819 = DSM 40847]QTT74614.1 esterase [Streptomyces mobaraensis NBRC 13819 = DSM 40847]